MRDGPMGHRFGCGDGSCIDWYRRHGVRVFSALSSGCLVYGAVSYTHPEPTRPAGLVLAFCFCLIIFLMKQNLVTNNPSRPKREPRPWRSPQLRTPLRLDSQRTESRKYTNNMPLMPVNAASITSVEPLAHWAVSRRIECCCTSKNSLL